MLIIFILVIIIRIITMTIITMPIAVEARICGFAQISEIASVGHSARKRSHEAEAPHIPERPPSVVHYAQHEGIAGFTLRHRSRC